jgi:hypothetical protein
MAEVVAEAERDPELDRRIAGVNAALYEEAGLTPLSEQGQVIRRLLATYLPSGVPQPEAPEEPLTVGDVAAKLEYEHAARKTMALLSEEDRQTNRRLQQSRAPLPAQVTGRTLPALIANLAAEASERYWRLFREAAVMLGMARERGQMELAAVRRQTERRPRTPRRPARGARSARGIAERPATYEVPPAAPLQTEEIGVVDAEGGKPA